jgi:hypothetical protein
MKQYSPNGSAYTDFQRFNSGSYSAVISSSGECYVGTATNSGVGFIVGGSPVWTVGTSGSNYAFIPVTAGQGLGGDGNGLGYIYGKEMSDPAAPATNQGVLYFRDNGSGKTELVVRFPTGAIQVIKTEP